MITTVFINIPNQTQFINIDNYKLFIKRIIKNLNTLINKLLMGYNPDLGMSWILFYFYFKNSLLTSY